MTHTRRAYAIERHLQIHLIVLQVLDSQMLTVLSVDSFSSRLVLRRADVGLPNTSRGASLLGIMTVAPRPYFPLQAVVALRGTRCLT